MSNDDDGVVQEYDDEEDQEAFSKVEEKDWRNRGARGSLEVNTDRRWKFRDIGDLSVMLNPHKKKMKKAKEFRLKRPEPMALDASSPYAEFLPTRFR